MNKKFDLAGKRFGYVTVIRRAVEGEYPVDGSNLRRWIVKCDCGSEAVKIGYNIKDSRTVRCSKKHCKIKLPACNRLKWGQAAKNLAYSQMKGDLTTRASYGAGRRVWELSIDEFVSITSKPCRYCGIKSSKEMGKFKNSDVYGFYEYNGIDRIDSSKGYILGNCVSCCKYCNYAKNNQTEDQFKTHLIEMYNHFVVGRENALSS